MSAQIFIIGNVAQLRRLISEFERLTFEKPWRITVEKVEPKRTLGQNAKLRAMEAAMAKVSGDDPGELHETLLKRRFGVKVRKSNGRTSIRPARRTSELSRPEFADYITWVQAFAAEWLGMEV